RPVEPRHADEVVAREALGAGGLRRAIDLVRAEERRIGVVPALRVEQRVALARVRLDEDARQLLRLARDRLERGRRAFPLLDFRLAGALAREHDDLALTFRHAAQEGLVGEDGRAAVPEPLVR